MEDERALLELTKRLLQKLGYAVLSATSPREAVRVAGEHIGDIHLPITDVVIPEMNGRELAGLLRSARPALKCLFMSGYTAEAIGH